MQAAIEALLITLGVKPRTVMQFRCRGRVPHMHRVKLLALAAERGIALTEADLDNLSLVRPRKVVGEQAHASSEERPSPSAHHLSMTATIDKASNAKSRHEAA